MFTKVMSVIGWAVVVAMATIAVMLVIMYNVHTNIPLMGDICYSVRLIDLHPELQNAVESVTSLFM